MSGKGILGFHCGAVGKDCHAVLEIIYVYVVDGVGELVLEGIVDRFE